MIKLVAAAVFRRQNFDHHRSCFKYKITTRHCTSFEFVTFNMNDIVRRLQALQTDVARTSDRPVSGRRSQSITVRKHVPHSSVDLPSLVSVEATWFLYSNSELPVVMQTPLSSLALCMSFLACVTNAVHLFWNSTVSNH